MQTNIYIQSYITIKLSNNFYTHSSIEFWIWSFFNELTCKSICDWIILPLSSELDWWPRCRLRVPYAHLLTFSLAFIYSYCIVKWRIQCVSKIFSNCRPNKSVHVLKDKSSSQTTCNVAKTSRAVALNRKDYRKSNGQECLNTSKHGHYVQHVSVGLFS